jgi:hypothetical protein
LEPSIETHFEPAFALAFFFHPDRDRAIGIAERAVRKLRVAQRAQVRRVYYRPSGRRVRHGMVVLRSRTKVSVERAQLLQRLVLHESEAVEREMESRAGIASLADEEIALRFVEHLVRSGWRRNSLYVAVALGRILYGYDTAAVLDLFATVVQDPERVPEDSYLRHVKRSLVREIEERFGPLLRTQVGARGEESFVTVPPTPMQRLLVARCLELLTPWDTDCPVPSGFDATKHPLLQLRFAGADPDGEHAIEVNRMHSLIHPDCLTNLASGLRLESPAERLRMPRPIRSSDTGGGDGPAPDRLHPPELGKPGLERLRSAWSRQPTPRAEPASRVVVSVDGRERLTVDARTGAHASCDLTEAAEVVEVKGSDRLGETLLAVHVLRLEPLTRAASTAREELRVALGRGRELLVVIAASPDGGSGRRLELAASCRATSIVSRLAAAWAGRRSANGRGSRMRAALTAASVISVLGLAVLVARWQRQDEPRRQQAEIHDAAASGETTRGLPAPERRVTLRTARLLFLDSAGGPDDERVIELLRTELLASGRFATTTDRDAADAALKARAVVEKPAVGTEQPALRLELELVDEGGEVLWSAAQSGSTWQALAATEIRDLVDRSR